MKKLWPSVACSAVLLSGCMYGSANAPITALNSNQYQQPSRAPVGQIRVAPGQAVALTPTRVATPQPATAVPQAQPTQQVQQAQPQQNQGIVVDAPSPYSQPARVQPTRPQPNSNDDGWSVAPQSAQAQQASTNTQSTVSEENQVQNQQSTNQAQPVRPVEQPPSSNTASATASNSTGSSNAATNSESEQGQQVASATPPQQPAAPAKEETAVSTLLKKASASLGKGDLDGAAAYLENAQRIEPQNAKILYDIANIRYHQGRYKDAETFAGRAVQVGGGNAMMKKSWALVANARKSLGDNQGAIAAAEKAASLGN